MLRHGHQPTTFGQPSIFLPTIEPEKDFIERTKVASRGIRDWASEQVLERKRLVVKIDTARKLSQFKWAAIRLSRSLSYSEIANEMVACGADEDDALDEATVRKGVQKILNTLGLQELPKTEGRL